VAQDEGHRQGARRVERGAGARRERAEPGPEPGPVEEEENEGEPPDPAVEDDQWKRPDVPEPRADGVDPADGAEELRNKSDRDPRSREIDAARRVRVREGVEEDRGPGRPRGGVVGGAGAEELEERVRNEEEPPAEDDPLGGGEGEDDAMEAGPERVDQGGGGARILRDRGLAPTRVDRTQAQVGRATHEMALRAPVRGGHSVEVRDLGGPSTPVLERLKKVGIEMREAQ
jgi:hypothetical protein